MNAAIGRLPQQAGAGGETGASEAASPDIPLVLDVDRSLVRADLLYEAALAYLRASPFGILRMAGWLMRGKAHLKRKLAEAAPIDTDNLPANDALAALAAEAKAAGRKVYLATAADAIVAESIAKRFGFVDGIIASDGMVNLKGEAKAERLAREFPQGFDYAGDSLADVPIWKIARKVLVVEGEPAVERATAKLDKPRTVIPAPSRLGALAKGMRLHQWAKNALVFVPAVLSGTIDDPHVLLAATLAFLALGLVASGTYLLNDLWDLADDRRHWSKRERPLASGRLPITTALLAVPAFVAGGAMFAWTIGWTTIAMLGVYLATTLLYSFKLKRVPILDGFTLASLFTLRLGVGIAAAGVWASPWLLVFSMFLFASLSFAKRHTEIARIIARGGSSVPGRGYVAADAPLLLALGVATGTASILIMVLYLINDAFSQTFYGNDHWLWLFPGALFLWNMRIWLVCQRGELNDDPVAFAIRDRPSLALGAVMAVAFVMAWAGAPL